MRVSVRRHIIYTPYSHNCAEQGGVCMNYTVRSEIRKIIKAFQKRVTRLLFQQSFDAMEKPDGDQGTRGWRGKGMGVG